MRAIGIISASSLAGIALVGAAGYVLLMYGPDLSASHFAFLTKGP